MNHRCRKFWALVLSASMLATGCQPQQPFYCQEDGDLSHYLDVATEIEYPDVHEPSLDEVNCAQLRSRSRTPTTTRCGTCRSRKRSTSRSATAR